MNGLTLFIKCFFLSYYVFVGKNRDVKACMKIDIL